MQNGQSLADFVNGNNNFESQLQQRMALAKQQGWSDSDIQNSANMERAMNQQQQAVQQQMQPQQAAPAQGGNFLTHLISMLGGAGGAAAGAGIGTAIMPGIGTLIGGGLGGLLGGFGGSAAQQEVENHNVNWGDALKTGGLDALFSTAMPVGGALLKGGTSGVADLLGAKEATALPSQLSDLFAGGSRPQAELQTAIENAHNAGNTTLEKQLTSQLSDQAMNPSASMSAADKQALMQRLKQTAAITPQKAGVIETMGKDLQAGGLGLAQGAKTAGMNSQLGAQASDNLVSTLKSLNVPLGSPESTQRALEPVMNTIGNKISSAYASANIPLTTEDVNAIGTNLLQKVSTQGGLSSSVESYALDQAQRLANVKDLNGLWNFRQQLDNSINFGRNAASADPANQQVATMLRDDINGVLNAKAPGVADLNQQYSAATTANNLLKSASKNTGGGLVQRLATSAPVKSLETKAGGIIENLGKGIAGTGSGSMAPVTAVTSQLTNQLPANLQNLFGGQQPATAGTPGAPGTTAAPTSDTTTYQALTDQLGAQAQQQGQPAQGTPYSSTDLATAAERALLAGDSKAASALDSAATEAAKVEAANGTTQKLTTAQQKDIASVKNASSLLDNVEQQFSAAGGGQGPLGYLLDTPVIGQYLNQNMGSYNKTKIDVAVAFAKAMMGSSGTGGSNQTLIKQVSDALPSATDTPAMAKQKLANLRQELQGRAQTVLTYPYTSADLPAQASTLTDLLGDGSSSSQLPANLSQLYGNTAL